MPHSLRAKLSGLRYKKIITDKDYQRLCNALDLEKAIDDIKSEIEKDGLSDVNGSKFIFVKRVNEIIDKHIGKE